jgi:hypothetical protein
MPWNECSQKMFLSLIQRIYISEKMNQVLVFSDSHNYLIGNAEHVWKVFEFLGFHVIQYICHIY